MKREVHLLAIKKNNMKGKNSKLVSYYIKLKSSYKRVFAQQKRKVRYIGIAKNQFAEKMNAIFFNVKRLIVLKSRTICLLRKITLSKS
ncbi:hypothetical protein [Rickettsia endosymbiont of Cardiosporidium cionae]|uniref:hypothetical protein n=1 Tax=Rickettsia endosymbiont of Cardiosporidium cionae TaxID=2777155 RepID=UPI001894F52A|nr:hypothetical protein [Rickettsia endosymbiont of Cardiosporidium cionae]KAF8818001.1 DDE transposase [Rickettsia endosymbiont of Cardiosporidium cionae]KAF8818377.1 DDE transposase [Rickettsia endosymbiont of Cardiosporidium cionae]